MLECTFNRDCKTSRKLREPSFEALVATECGYISFVSADLTPAIESSTAQQQLITFTAKMLHSFWVSRSRLVAGGTKISRKNVQNNVEHSSLSVTIQIFMAISLKHDLDHLCMNFFIWDTRQHSEGRVWMHISRSLLSFHSLMSWADQDQKIFNGLKKYLSSSENICPDGCKWRVMSSR